MFLSGPKLHSKSHIKIHTIHSNLLNHIEDEDNVRSQEVIERGKQSNLIDNPPISSEYTLTNRRREFPFFKNNRKNQGLNGFILNVKKIKIVNKVVEHLKQMSYFRKPTNLKKYHYNLFDDKTINPFAKEKKVILYNFVTNIFIKSSENFNLNNQNMVDFLRKLIFESLPLIPPNSQLKIAWETIMIFLIIFNFFIITVEISFNENLWKEQESTYYMANVGAFAFDIFINFSSAYYENGQIVEKRKKIINHYIKRGFFFDLFATIGLIFGAPNNFNFRFVSLLFCIQILSIKKRYAPIEEVIYFGQSYDLILVMIKIVCMAHVFACLWHACSYYQYNDGKTWITLLKLQNHPWMDRYLYSIYWALTTMMTVGYGDITPQNKIETCFCILTFLIGTIVFGYCLNVIGALMAEINEKDKKLRENLRIIGAYMKEHNINLSLRDQVQKFLKYLWKLETKNINREQDLINKLPKNLRREILSESLGKNINKFDVLKRNFSPELLSRLIDIAYPIRLSPSEIIFKKGETENFNLYLILDGEIEIFLDYEKQKIIGVAKQFDVIGVKEFFCSLPNTETTRSKSFSYILKIEKLKFLEILKDFPLDQQVFFEMKDLFLIYNQTNCFFSPCYSCKSTSHFFEDCPAIHYFPNKLIHISRLIFSANQNRNTRFKRLRSKSGSSLMNLVKIKKHAFKTRFDKQLMASFTMNSSVPSLIKDESDLKKDINHEGKSEPCIEFKHEQPKNFHSLTDLKNFEENNFNFSVKKEISNLHDNSKNSISSLSKSMLNETNFIMQKLKKSIKSNSINSGKTLNKKLKTVFSNNNLSGAPHTTISSSQSIYEIHKNLTNSFNKTKGNNKFGEVSSFEFFDKSSLEILRKLENINSNSDLENKQNIDFINSSNDNDKYKNNNNNSNIHNVLKKDSNSEIINNEINACLVGGHKLYEKKIMFNMDFENMKSYKKYFKHNNCELIMKSANAIFRTARRRAILKRLSSKKKRTTLNSILNK